MALSEELAIVETNGNKSLLKGSSNDLLDSRHGVSTTALEPLSMNYLSDISAVVASEISSNIPLSYTPNVESTVGVQDVFQDGSNIVTYQLNGNLNALNGVGPNATQVGTLSYNTGKYDSCATGNAGAIDTGVNLSVLPNWSISFWFKSLNSTYPAFNSTTGKSWDTNAGGMRFSVNAYTGTVWMRRNGWYSEVDETFTGTMDPLGWNHIGIVKENDFIKAVYINGEEFLPQLLNTAAENDCAFSTVFMGERNVTGQDGSINAIYRGNIDQIRLFNRALSKTEMLVLASEQTIPETITYLSHKYTQYGVLTDTTSKFDLFDDGSELMAFNFDGVTDDMGGAYNLVPRSGSPTFEVGKYNQALHTGNGSNFEIFDPLRYTGVKSFSYWVQNQQDVQSLLHYDNHSGITDICATAKVFILRSGISSNALYFDAWGMDADGCDGNSGVNITGRALADGEWVHITVVTDGRTWGDVYEDGVYLGRSSIPVPQVVDNNDSLQIGFRKIKGMTGGTTGAEYAYDTIIDQLRFFNREVTQGEIDILCNEQFTPTLQVTSSNEIFLATDFKDTLGLPCPLPQVASHVISGNSVGETHTLTITPNIACSNIELFSDDTRVSFNTNSNPSGVFDVTVDVAQADYDIAFYGILTSEASGIKAPFTFTETFTYGVTTPCGAVYGPVPLFQDYYQTFNELPAGSQSWGSPLPRIITSDSSTGSALDTNGDGSYHSGLGLNGYPIPTNKQFKVTWRAKQPLVAVNYWLYYDMGLYSGQHVYSTTDGSPAAWAIWGLVGGLSRNTGTQYRYSKWFSGGGHATEIDYEGNDGLWHEYSIFYSPALDGVNCVTEFYYDGVLQGTGCTTLPAFDNFYVGIEGRSYSGDNHVDWVKVEIEV